MLLDVCIGGKLYSTRCYGHCADLFHLLKGKTKSANSVLFLFLASSVHYASHKSNSSEEKRICQFLVIEESIIDQHDTKRSRNKVPFSPLGFVGCNA
jgi:hypothetical protein